MGPMPNHLIALHEYNHHRQGGVGDRVGGPAELTPSLADIPQTAQWWHMRRQARNADHLPVPPELDVNLTTPGGAQWNSEFMLPIRLKWPSRNQAKGILRTDGRR